MHKKNQYKVYKVSINTLKVSSRKVCSMILAQPSDGSKRDYIP